MAISVTINPNRALQNLAGRQLDRVVNVWLNAVGDLWIANMAAAMPYSTQRSRRGQPPLSKTGFLAGSLRKSVSGRTLSIHGAAYGQWLVVNLDRDFVTKGWERTAPQLDDLFRQASRQVLGG